MDRHGAMNAKHDLIVILIVTTATNSATSVVLGNLSPLLQADVLDIILKLKSFGLVNIISIALCLVHLVHLIHDLAISELIPLLLRQLKLLKEICLQLAWIINVQQKQAQVFSVPIEVFHHVLSEGGVHIRQEILVIFPNFLRSVNGHVPVVFRILGHI